MEVWRKWRIHILLIIHILILSTNIITFEGAFSQDLKVIEYYLEAIEVKLGQVVLILQTQYNLSWMQISLACLLEQVHNERIYHY